GDFVVLPLLVVLLPRIFHVAQIAEPLGALVANRLQDDVDRLRVLRGNAVGIGAGYRGDSKLPPVRIPQFPDDRTVSPSANGLLENRLVVPYGGPRLRVIDKLLELHGRHWALLLQNVLRDVQSRDHAAVLRSPKV